MAKKRRPSGQAPQKASLWQSIGAIVAGVLAVKLASYIVTTGWRLATGEDPPQMDEPVSAAKKAVWLAIFGGLTGAARQAARDKVKPPTLGPA